jgi:uncharacterized protein YaaR (DUF327 family)
MPLPISNQTNQKLNKNKKKKKKNTKKKKNQTFDTSMQPSTPSPNKNGVTTLSTSGNLET